MTRSRTTDIFKDLPFPNAGPTVSTPVPTPARKPPVVLVAEPGKVPGARGNPLDLSDLPPINTAQQPQNLPSAIDAANELFQSGGMDAATFGRAYADKAYRPTASKIGALAQGIVNADTGRKMFTSQERDKQLEYIAKKRKERIDARLLRIQEEKLEIERQKAQRANPKSNVGKLQSDLTNGLIDQSGYDTGMAALSKPLVSNTEEKAYDKEVGKNFAQLYTGINEQATSAYGALNSIALMESLMSDPGFHSGMGSDSILQLQRLVTALGGAPDGVDSMEAFSAEAKKLALDNMGGSLGAGFSNADRDFVTGQVPGLENTPAGNQKILEINKRIAERKIQIAGLAQQYVEQNGRMDNGFHTALREFAEQNPLFTTEDKANPGWNEMGGGIRIRER